MELVWIPVFMLIELSTIDVAGIDVNGYAWHTHTHAHAQTHIRMYGPTYVLQILLLAISFWYKNCSQNLTHFYIGSGNH